MTKLKIAKKKGGCGCQSSIKGGTSFNVNNPSVNPFNNYNTDPSDPSQVISVRIQPNMNSSFLSGGKKRKTKRLNTLNKSKKSKNTKKRRRIHMKKGGADPVLYSQNANVTSSFNTVLGAQTSANLITGTNDQIMNSDMKINQEMPFI